MPRALWPLVVLAVGALLGPAAAHAATLTWDGDTASAGLQDGGGTWNTTDANRWWNGASYQAWSNLTPDSAIFGVGTGAAGTVTLGESITVGNITFNAPGSGNYTITGGTLTLSGSPTIAANASATISSSLAGTGFTKTGAGTLTLSGTNSYSGTTTVNAGVLRVTALAALPGNVAVLAGGTFDLNALNLDPRAFTIAGTGAAGQIGALVNTAGGAESRVGSLLLSADATIGTTGSKFNVSTAVNGGGHTLTVAGTGETNIRGANALTNLAGVTVASGLLRLENSQNWTGTITVQSGARLDTWGNHTIASAVDLRGGRLLSSSGTGTWTGPVTLTNDSTIDAVGGQVNLNGTLSGSGKLTKAGANTLVLAGSNAAYTGPIAVDAGILRLGSAAALGSSSGVTVASGATVDVAGYNANKMFTIAGSGTSGQGALINTGGDIIGNVGVTLAADATIGVTGGRFDIGIGYGLNGNGYTLTKVGSGNLPIRNAAGSFGAIAVNQGTLYFETDQSGMTSTPITVAGGARVGMYYTNPISAPVTLNGGTVAHLGGGSGTTSTWSGAFTLNSTSTLATPGGNMAVTGNISGPGGLDITGPYTLTLSGTNSYQGTTTVNSGILKLGSASALGNTPGVTVASGGTVDVAGFNANKNFTIAGSGTTGQGALVNTGADIIGSVGVTLAADATIGVTGGRFDIGITYGLNGNGYTLTKVGSGTLPIRSDAGSFGAIQVNGGTVYFETDQNSMGGTPVTVATGATFGMYYGRTTNTPVILNGGTLSHIGGGGTSIWNGPVTVAADSAIATPGGSLRINGLISGSGSLAVAGANTLEITTSGSVGGLRGNGNVALGSGVQFTVGSNGDDNIWTGRLSGAGSFTKTGTGLLAMTNGASTYAGGTNVSGGDLAALSPGALGSGTVTLSGGTLNLAVPLVAAAGFGGNGAGWTLNGGAAVAGDVLTVTTNSTSQARSAFYNLPVATSDFTINFTYSADDGGTNPADGLAVVFQTDVRGPYALGSGGGSLGYGGTNGITPSTAVALNLYTGASGGRGIGNQVMINGGGAGGYGSTSPVELYNTPVDVELVYSGTTLTATLTQGSNTFTKTYTGVNLPGTLGAMAFLGFTGGTGGAVARQQVSNFSYLSTAVPATAYSNALAVSAGTTGEVDLLVTPASTSYSMGSLAMGSGATLSLGAVPGSVADLDFGLTLGTTTLAGPAAFDVANNGAGAGTLTLGPVGQSGGPGSLTKTGAGTLVLPGANTYTGTTTVSAGKLLVHGTHTGGDLYTVTPAGTLGGTGTITASVLLQGAVSPGASVGTLTTGSETWDAGASYLWEISDVDAGPGAGWDLLAINGTLAIAATPAQPFTIDVVSLALGGAPGAVHDFDPLGVYIWEIARTTGGVTGFAEDKFLVDLGGFQNNWHGGRWFVSQADGSVYLNYAIPEPSTFALAAIALLALGACAWRRRS